MKIDVNEDHHHGRFQINCASSYPLQRHGMGAFPLAPYDVTRF
jgi:hypothetical protein